MPFSLLTSTQTQHLPLSARSPRQISGSGVGFASTRGSSSPIVDVASPFIPAPPPAAAQPQPLQQLHQRLQPTLRQWQPPPQQQPPPATQWERQLQKPQHPAPPVPAGEHQLHQQQPPPAPSSAPHAEQQSTKQWQDPQQVGTVLPDRRRSGSSTSIRSSFSSSVGEVTALLQAEQQARRPSPHALTAIARQLAHLSKHRLLLAPAAQPLVQDLSHLLSRLAHVLEVPQLVTCVWAFGHFGGAAAGSAFPLAAADALLSSALSPLARRPPPPSPPQPTPPSSVAPPSPAGSTATPGGVAAPSPGTPSHVRDMRLGSVMPQGVVKLIWGFAKAGLHHHSQPSLWAALAAAALPAREPDAATSADATTPEAQPPPKLSAAPVRDEAPTRAAAGPSPSPSHYTGPELSRLLWGLATAGCTHQPLLASAAAAALLARGPSPGRRRSTAEELTAPEFADVVWALCEMGHTGDTPLWSRLARLAATHLPLLSPPDVVSVATAFSTVARANSGAAAAAAAVHCAIGAAVHPRLPQFGPRDLSALLLALARPNNPDAVAALPDALLDAIAAHAAPHLERYSGRDLARLLVAYARRRCRHKALLASASAAVKQLASAGGLAPHDVSDIAWSFQALDTYEGDVYESLVQAALCSMGDFTPQEVSGLLWSLARARHHNPALLAAALQHLQPQLRTCTIRDLCHVTVALATFHHLNLADVAALGAEVLGRLRWVRGRGRPTLQQVCTLAWAFAVLQYFDGQLFGQLFRRFDGAVVAGGVAARRLGLVGSSANGGRSNWVAQQRDGLNMPVINAASALQLFQAHMLMCGIYSGVVPQPALLDASVLTACRRMWTKNRHHGASPSAFQVELCYALSDMGAGPRLEEVTEDALLSIDIALTWQGRRVAVEADGSFHFTRTTPRRPLGSTLARWHCLELRGWCVVSIAAADWYALPSDADSRHRFLRDSLDSALWRTHAGSKSRPPRVAAGARPCAVGVGELAAGEGGAATTLISAVV